MKIFAAQEIKKAYHELNQINDIEENYKNLKDEDFKKKTEEFKSRLAKGETLNDIRVEAFALTREATYRVLNKRPFDVQILGGLILDYGSIAEMKTGEGKTITSIAPVYLNALKGEGVIVSTVNEYLTQRDAEEMGKVHKFLGLTVGVNLNKLSPTEKRNAYACDITYSVHSEVGFDYLRDNMVKHISEKVQRKLNFCLIDEVDSILIDEARTPLIISGGSVATAQVYLSADMFVKTLKTDDYEIDWEVKSIQLTNSGIDKANSYFKVNNIFEITNSDLVHRISNALRAVYIMSKDVDYIIRNEKIEIVDAFTGRILEGRTFSDGLHQAIQAKEKVKIEPENHTMATITYQNLFRMFSKLCGMTGTAKTEEQEFVEVYNMRVHQIPTNKPMIRVDYPDVVFGTLDSKYKALVEEVKTRNLKGQPILIGTEEVAESEILSSLLSKANINHTVLNAKQNEKEAETIAQAGEIGAVTIATNMAGRGTDIKPSPESIKAGGLYVIGTNRAESRRIDLQLIGRSGRQGDVGESRFYLSLQDKLLTRFSNFKKLDALAKTYGEKPIKGRAVSKLIKKAQLKIEGFNYDSRKHVLQYDDIIRQHRDLIYAQRDIIISQSDLINVIERMQTSVVRDLITDNTFDSVRNKDKTLDLQKLVHTLNILWFIHNDKKLNIDQLTKKSDEEIVNIIDLFSRNAYKDVRQMVIQNYDELMLHDFERSVILGAFDQNWQLHLDKMSKLRSSTSLASYAQKNPFQVYIEEGTKNFNDLLKRIAHNAVASLTSNRYAMPVKKSPEEIMIEKEVAEKIAQNEFETKILEAIVSQALNKTETEEEKLQKIVEEALNKNKQLPTKKSNNTNVKKSSKKISSPKSDLIQKKNNLTKKTTK